MNDEKIYQLRLIAIEYLYEGMELLEDIYSYNGKILLLAKGDMLTENKINKMKNFNENNRNVLVADKTYNALMEHGENLVPRTLDQKALEQYVGYSGVKTQTENFLRDIELSELVSKEQAEKISSDMVEMVTKVDPSLIFQCINTPNPIDEYLRRHSVNVGLLNGLMGKWLNLSKKEIDELVLAGLVHDIGKTQIPEDILNAPRKLTRTEYEVMKQHTIYSYNLLGIDERFGEQIRLAARHHHERANGSGYPDKLSIKDISLYARITAISDIYDAMVSKRCYKEANNPFSILSQLADMRFSDLDTSLVKVFTDHMPTELIGKPFLLSDGSIGVIKHIMPDDLEHPLIEVNGKIKKTDDKLYCIRVISDE